MMEGEEHRTIHAIIIHSCYVKLMGIVFLPELYCSWYLLQTELHTLEMPDYLKSKLSKEQVIMVMNIIISVHKL